MKLPTALAERIIAGSHGHKRRNVPDFALYGCIYRLDDAPHVVRAHIRHTQKRVYHVEFRYIAEKWPRPPKEINSPEILATALREAAQEVMIECNAQFIYNEKNGWRSTIEVPVPIAERDESKKLFTHIDAYRFSKREQDQIQYSIEIERIEGDIRHWVYLAEAWKGVLSEEVPEQLLFRSSGLSKAFLSIER